MSLIKQLEANSAAPMACVACGSMIALVEKYFNSQEFHDEVSLMLLNSDNQSHQEDVTDIINFILGRNA